jgi:hypothetical protein
MVRGAGCHCQALVPRSPRLPVARVAHYLPPHCRGRVCIRAPRARVPRSPRIQARNARIPCLRRLCALAEVPRVWFPRRRRVRVRDEPWAVVGHLVPRLGSPRSPLALLYLPLVALALILPFCPPSPLSFLSPLSSTVSPSPLLPSSSRSLCWVLSCVARIPLA